MKRNVFFSINFYKLKRNRAYVNSNFMELKYFFIFSIYFVMIYVS